MPIQPLRSQSQSRGQSSSQSQSQGPSLRRDETPRPAVASPPTPTPVSAPTPTPVASPPSAAREYANPTTNWPAPRPTPTPAPSSTPEPSATTMPRFRPGRSVEGIAAVLMPFVDDLGTYDWPGFRAGIARVAEAGLMPAVNMDTGHVAVLEDEDWDRVLDETVDVLGAGRPFVAGAFVEDAAGAPLALDAYLAQVDAIRTKGGTPIVFPSHGLTSLPDDQLVAAYEAIGKASGRFLAFELGTMFAPAHFARRDRLFAANDPAYLEVNDALQALGSFAFRTPVPAYKHSAAMVHKLRGWIKVDSTHPGSPRRPDTDRAVLSTLLDRLGPSPRD